ncbi:TetR/AcrR family transcriptional regulator [Sulfitobacter sp. S190]|uniref:TetR/AcrR family transcriptional regulator n=1 Tax=Sulfitobacter sp. S190 TaxID=2867022 RepID=UPI0021A6CDC5|nr:TetR/AcrR family transcriptional regulator [Sulfitobacter sp. S190]UWR24318.1 TetR/AcrR family transcriptional regulator [Sulfitobacter sp. S190]
MTDTKKTGVRGPGRTTRTDWLTAAMDTLVSEGVDQVKVLTLAQKLDCPRSSFYWYFKNRSELLDALLETWAATNTKAIIAASRQPAQTINFAVAKLYSAWVVGNEFDMQLDFAVRDWARRSGTVRRALDLNDAQRIEALTEMFLRHGFDEQEADVRARIIYFTQIGYDALDQRESWDIRRTRAAMYLYCMTGQTPTEAETEATIDMP